MHRIVAPFARFVTTQTVTSAIMLLAAVAALGLANSPFRHAYHAVLDTEIGVSVGDWRLAMSLHHWVNDGLMAVFFFVLGLEIKREFLAGAFRTAARSRLLVVTALGGMVVPAALFALLAPAPASAGWGIPMATDTAFAIGVLALLGTRIPRGLTAMLVGLAIVDDIGAVLVIAAFYTDSIALTWLAVAGGVLGAMALANVGGLRHPVVYLLGGIALWYAVLQSGVHSTVAGVLAATTVPARVQVLPRRFERRVRNLIGRLHSRRRGRRDILGDPPQHAIVEALRREATAATTPLLRWENSLENVTALFILPVFALANAGVALGGHDAPLWGDRLPLAILVGLVVGKGIGISAACQIARMLGFGTLPDGVRMRHVLGMSLVAGMGFTMSIFVANLAYADDPDHLAAAKSAVLAGSLVAGVLGYLTLRVSGGDGARAAAS